MLFGYIYEIVRDNNLAEQHVINIYNYIPDHIHEFGDNLQITWHQLQRLTKSYLEHSNSAKYDYQIHNTGYSKYDNRNRFLRLMTEEQKQVFCNAYYSGKTTAELSKELNKPEELIRSALKGAFIIIKKG